MVTWAGVLTGLDLQSGGPIKRRRTKEKQSPAVTVGGGSGGLFES